MIYFKSLFENTNIVVLDPNIFLLIDTTVADASDDSPNVIKMLLRNGLSTFPIKGKLVFSNSLRSLPRNPIDCPFLYNRVFDGFILD